MEFDPSRLSTYSNMQAAAFIANAISKLGMEKLGFSKVSEAHDQLGDQFWTSPNNIKNFRDAVDPYYENGRVGWNKAATIRPNYLAQIKEEAERYSQDQILEMCAELRAKDWLPDLEKAIADGQTELKSAPSSAAMEIDPEIKRDYVSFLANRGVSVIDDGPTAVRARSRSGRESIHAFSLFPNLMALRAFIRATKPYLAICAEILGELQSEIPAEVHGTDTATKLGKAIQTGAIPRERVLKALADLNPQLSADAKEKFYEVVADSNKRFFNKTPFKDGALPSKVCDLANIELAKVNVSEFIDFIANSSVDLRMESQHDVASRNILIYGAPGTGKSFEADNLITSVPEHIHKAVFYSEYQNADFVGSLRPSVSEEKVTYRFVAGPLTNAWVDALLHPDEPVVLIIDELNRGNAPSIFGEAFQLLDRGESGASQYEINLPEEVAKHIAEKTGRSTDDSITEKYGFPRNFYIVGTMNSADQGVFPLDTAFKRRWNFRYLPIDFSKHGAAPGFSSLSIKIGKLLVSWVNFATTINSVLEENDIAEDRFLGPFFLSPTELKTDSLSDVVAQKVLPYLWEDVLKLGDERSIIFDTIAFNSFTSLQSAFLNGDDVFNADIRHRLGEQIINEQHYEGE